jgi:thioredoxin-related protein
MFRFARGAAARTALWVAFLAPISALASGSSASIGWQFASTDADVDRAFALAKNTHKPVFLYWGAVWCPPCNQVKATLFSRPDFAERSRSFVPVYVDGDKPGAQKLAARFKVAGYPTMVVFKPDGVEVARLPGEVDPERYLVTLDNALNSEVSIKELVRRGLSHEALTPAQWRLLSFYSWDTDDQVIFKTNELARQLAELSAAVPPQLRDVKDRLLFKAIAARASDSGIDVADGTRASDRASVEKLLSSANAVHELRELLVYSAEPVVKYAVPPGNARAELAHKWDAVLQGLIAGGELSRADTVAALDARIAMWKESDRSNALSADRQEAVRREIMHLVNQTTDRYERQAVVPDAAGVLASAGLLQESDAILKAELPRAVAPYYHMLVLASNAKKRGDNASALTWYERAWRTSEGPATRLQWGSAYVRELVALAPYDSARISGTASNVVRALQTKEETFFGRNERSLQKMAKQLVEWQGNDASRIRTVAKIRAQLSRKCEMLPRESAGRSNCAAAFAAASAKPSS